MKTTLFLAWLLFFVFSTDASESVDYVPYAQVLKAYVNETGKVDYRKLKENRALLDSFLTEIAGMKRTASYETWDEQERIAFWINLYNAWTLRAIIDHYPIQPTFPARLTFPRHSIRQIKGVWDKLRFGVMGETKTLDEIEHEILRKEFKEPRIHMALVCAALGCPPLRNEPYTGEKLNLQLNDQTRRFLDNPNKFWIDKKHKVVRLSPIFKWFGNDFVARYKTDSFSANIGTKEKAVLNFISGYLNETDRSFLKKGDYTIRYLEYDWSLNEQPPEKGTDAEPK